MKEIVKIGNWAAFWGDSPSNVGDLLDGVEDLDYLVSDYLAEVTIALLARSLRKDPEGGYVPEAVDALAPHMERIAARGIRVLTNAGGLNPRACAAALRRAAEEAGADLTVAAVEGDDLRARIADLAQGEWRDMFNGEPLPPEPATLNAYIGARPLAAALDLGADIVVAGRCVDAAVVLAPLIHEFGWAEDDYDLLAAGMLAGHLLECGPQVTGGLHTDWDAVPGWDRIGSPVAECRPGGETVIAKPPGSGGLVTPATVGEQMLYEIGDPGAYLLPDVTCDWRGVTLEQVGPDRVEARGARGSAPPPFFKATATSAEGYRSVTTALLAGFDAAGKARRAGEAVVARTERLLAARGIEPLEQVSIEVVGAGDLFGAGARPDTALEAVLKLGVSHPRREALEVFAREYVSVGLVAQGFGGVFAGRPRIAPVFRVYHLPVERAAVSPRVIYAGEEREVAPGPGSEAALAGSEPLPEDGPAAPAGRTVQVPLRRLAYGRSGDKGDSANIGLIARRPEFLPLLREQVTAARVGEFFAHLRREGAPVRRWELPGIAAINILVEDVLGGAGGTSSLRYDPQGKSYAAMLLTMPVAVPAAWESSGLLAAA